MKNVNNNKEAREYTPFQETIFSAVKCALEFTEEKYKTADEKENVGIELLNACAHFKRLNETELACAAQLFRDVIRREIRLAA